MNGPLPLERFRELADAYGGVIARWPEAYRDAAMRTARSPAAQTLLAQAVLLDVALDTWRAPPPPADLRSRILASAPSRARRFARARLWWSGIGIAAALSGAVAGSAAVAMITPADASDSGTSFGDVVAQDS
ncbi:hypothetical protein [Sphingomonas sp. PAMC 26605]|uniref:hypothetical protein n=1 Tax=Sphingomonas sp. PAMC 26605 TaxID=1112214 RepID=UPI00026CDDE9|nr:hypothetical protein [Sphingomonas sp. PAMC 26605]